MGLGCIPKNTWGPRKKGMKMAGSGPTGIHKRMAEILEANPQGLTMGEWREKLDLKPTEHNQLDRRKRDLKKWYVIRQVRAGSEFRYFFDGKRETPLGGRGISQRDRAEVLHRAHGRCAMCGRTIDRHGITLVVDHKIPKDWGGSDRIDNLWAICDECNAGKKNYFGSQDQSLMRTIMRHSSIHMRIGEALLAYGGKEVPSYLIEFIGGQDDWRKRLRELRYLGWVIPATKKKVAGRIKSFYSLKKSTPWPDNPTAVIREYEKQRAARNRSKR
jgi:hypothetical protein